MKMNKKYLSYTIILSLFLSIIFVTNVSSNSVSNIIETPGAVNCIITFTCSDTTDNIVIYWGEHSGITTGDNATYTDSTDILRGNRAGRKMLIRGLNDSTLYYYRIYAVGEGWAASEDSFTTLPRFSTIFKDEFFDTYYVDGSYGVDIQQQVGVKSGVLISTYDPVSGATGVGYINVMNDGGTWRCWGVNYSLLTSDNYYTSTDGVTWSSETVFTASPSPEEVMYPNIVYIGGTWYNLYKESGGSNDGRGTLASCGTPAGTYTEVNDTCVRYFGGSRDEADVSSLFNDTLGANDYYLTGQTDYTANSNNREVGLFVSMDGINDWYTFSDNFNIPATDDEGGTFTDQSYTYTCYIKSGVYVGMNHYYKGSGNTGTIEPYLCVSRNGWSEWELVNGSTAIIPLGTTGQWDDGMIFPNRLSSITVGDYEYLYYNGWDGEHDDATRHSDIGRIRFRVDGLTAVKPTSSNAWVRTTTIDGNFTGDFTVNYNGSGSNDFKIAVLNPATNIAYTGFNYNDFNTINTNSTSINPSWGSGNTLSQIPTGDFKLNFSWSTTTGGELFSYEMDNDSYIQFISINGQQNNTVVNTNSRTFIWNTIPDTDYYQLQVSNNSIFTDVFINLSDINEVNYGVNFTDTGTTVTFILPSVYDIIWTGSHYYRVRSHST